MNKPTRFYSTKQERKVAKIINGRKVANSGATAFQKGDVSTDTFLIECKTSTQPKKSFTIQKEWLIKNAEEAFAMGRPYSAVAIDFGDGDNYFIIDSKLFNKLMVCLKEEK